MRMLLKQRFLSWFDSYDIYDETGNDIYVVKGQLDWRHCFIVYDASGNELGMIREKVLTFLPKFEIYRQGNLIGEIKKEFTFFKPQFDIDYKGWLINGDFLQWDYTIKDYAGSLIASISKEIFNWTDTYNIDVYDPSNALDVLLFVLAMDAEKCSRS